MGPIRSLTNRPARATDKISALAESGRVTVFPPHHPNLPWPGRLYFLRLSHAESALGAQAFPGQQGGAALGGFVDQETHLGVRGLEIRLEVVGA